MIALSRKSSKMEEGYPTITGQADYSLGSTRDRSAKPEWAQKKLRSEE
jgi:hypothetical protein